MIGFPDRDGFEPCGSGATSVGTVRKDETMAANLSDNRIHWESPLVAHRRFCISAFVLAMLLLSFPGCQQPGQPGREELQVTRSALTMPTFVQSGLVGAANTTDPGVGQI
jgi:hypothetical protein